MKHVFGPCHQAHRAWSDGTISFCICRCSTELLAPEDSNLKHGGVKSHFPKIVCSRFWQRHSSGNSQVWGKSGLRLKSRFFSKSCFCIWMIHLPCIELFDFPTAVLNIYYCRFHYCSGRNCYVRSLWDCIIWICRYPTSHWWVAWVAPMPKALCDIGGGHGTLAFTIIQMPNV